MDTTGMKCPRCGKEEIVLLATTNELKWWCEACDARFTDAERRNPEEKRDSDNAT